MKADSVTPAAGLALVSPSRARATDGAFNR